MIGNPAIPFPSINRPVPDLPVSVVTPDAEYNVDYSEPVIEPMTTKAEHDAQTREILHALMLSSTTLNKALTQRIEQPPPPNGNANRNTIIAALLIAFIPQAFSAVWWTRGTERDTTSRVQTLENTVTNLTNEFNTQRTWSEKMRLNLADKGWLVDPVTGSVTRVRK